MNLFDIDQQIRDLMSQTDEDGVVTDEAMEQLLGLEQTTDIKMEALACLIKERRADAKAIKAESDTLAKRARTTDNDADRMEAYLTRFMEQTGRDKFQTARCALSFRKSEAVVLDDESSYKMFPELWKTPEPVPDKVKIKEFINKGYVIPGARLEGRWRIQIR